MKITLALVEDALISSGFRRMASLVEGLNPDTRTVFVSTGHWRSIRQVLKGDSGGGDVLDEARVHAIAEGLAGADVIGFSSMTGYAELTRRVIRRLREIAPQTYLIWGGIHPITDPEDAIRSEVDAICTGEGELVLPELLDALRAGRRPLDIKNFWFRESGQVHRNGFRPLLTPQEMDTFPLPHYGEGEWIFRDGQGFVPLTLADYLKSDGLGYNTVWSIGCPFHCNYCGNTTFIANDPKYARIRHPSPQRVVAEVQAACEKNPRISTVSFHDDSFLAIPFRQLEEFAEVWRAELHMPFAVLGVIPNYVRRDKLELLTWAGLNRVRMGIQSGSQRILDFYDRPTPVEKVESAATVLASFAPRYHIPPAYDVILDNPIETRQDVVDTLELLYRLPRPFTLNTFSLRVIPKSRMEAVMVERGVDLAGIDSSYAVVAPRWANVVTYMLAVFRPPRWVFERLLRRVEASSTPQPKYPWTALFWRVVFMLKRAGDHLRFMDFSMISGYAGYVCWRLGLVALRRRVFDRRHPRPEPDTPRAKARAVGRVSSGQA